MKISIFIPFFLIYFSNIYGQKIVWSIQNEYLNDSIIFFYDYTNSKGLQKSKFEFLSYNLLDTNYYTNSVSQIKINKKQNYFVNILNLPKIKIGRIEKGKFISSITKGNLYLKFQYYTKNIDSLEIFIKFSSDDEYKKIKNLNFFSNLRYQEPEYFLLNEYKFERTQNDTIVYVEDLKIRGHLKGRDVKLIIGELALMRREKISFNYNEWERYIEPKKSKLLLYKSYMGNEYNNYHLFKIQLPKLDNKKNEVIHIGMFIHEVLKNYKNYDIKGLSRETILNKHLEIMHRCDSLEQYYLKLDHFLTQFNDPHLRLYWSNNEIKAGISPLYFDKIQNKDEIIAVFDTSLTMKPGNILKTINNISIDSLITWFIEYERGTLKERRKKAMDHLIYHAFTRLNDSTLQITYLDSTNQIKVDLYNNDRYRQKYSINIPSNFKFSTSYIYEDIDNISYVKLSSIWNKEEVVPFFYTHFADIEKKNGIILDLRNCGSADFYSILFIYSLFINRASVLMDINIDDRFMPINSNNTYESIVAKPYINNFSKPLVILINSKTTCGAEILCSALKNSSLNVTLIGSEPTAGAAQFLQKVQLPYKEWLVLAYYNSILYTNNNEIDRIGGINPSIQSYYSSYKDLAPYSDKLKKMAIEYLIYNTKHFMYP